MVEAHLGSCEACRRLVSALASASASAGAERGAPPAPRRAAGEPEIAPGDVLAHKYEVVSVLGRGGMGVVLEAQHRTLGQRVALKFLRGTLASDAAAVSRFFREARAAASLGSEHVVRILDADWLPSGEPFLAMELLEGRDLAAELHARGPLPIPEVAALVLQASEALALAHARGIVHRDIKPANLFLTRGVDGSPVLKVLDFGVAKVREAGDGGTGQTDPAAIVGSPRYMAPEQLQASARVDARADVWALAVTTFELLSGVTPFDGSTLLEICAAIVTGAPKRLSDVRPDAPPALVAALERALARDRDARTGSVLQLAEELAPFAPPGAAAQIEKLRRIAGGSIPPARGPSSRPPPPSAAAVGVDSTLAASSLAPSRAVRRPPPHAWAAGAAARTLAGGAARVARRTDPIDAEQAGRASVTGAAASPEEASTRPPASTPVTAAASVVAARVSAGASAAPSASPPSVGAPLSPRPASVSSAPPSPVERPAPAPPPSSNQIHRDGLLDRK